jgi:hypothetical protein
VQIRVGALVVEVAHLRNNGSLKNLKAPLEIDVRAQRAVSVNGVETQEAEARKLERALR